MNGSSIKTILALLLYGVCLMTFVLLAWTGFYPLLAGGGAVTGYPLLFHTLLGAVFLACLAVLAVLRAPANALMPEAMQARARAEGRSELEIYAMRFSFWGVLVYSVLSAAPIILCMTPLAGEAMQSELIFFHRMASAGLLFLAAAHTVLHLRPLAGKAINGGS